MSTLLNKRKEDTIDSAVRNYARENYSEALEDMATLWAFYTIYEREEYMTKCDNIMLRLMGYSKSKDNLSTVHWRGMMRFHEISDSFKDYFSDVDEEIKELSDKIK